MKKMVERFKAGFFKKGAVLMLAGVMLCSQSLTAVAAPAEQATLESVHMCAYSIVDQTFVRLHKMEFHNYYDGSTEINPDGSSSPVSKTCVIMRVEYKGTKKCACGNTLGECSWIETTHSDCGIPTQIEW